MSIEKPQGRAHLFFVVGKDQRAMGPLKEKFEENGFDTKKMKGRTGVGGGLILGADVINIAGSRSRFHMGAEGTIGGMQTGGQIYLGKVPYWQVKVSRTAEDNAAPIL